MVNPESLPFPFEPITDLSPIVIGAEYILFLLLAGVVGSISHWFYTKYIKQVTLETDVGEVSLFKLIMAGPIEELIFRGGAVVISGFIPISTVTALFLANGVFAGFHIRGARAAGFVFVLGLFLTKFWYFGFDNLLFLGAIVMHSLHNTIVWILANRSDKRIVEQENAEPSSISYVT